MPREVRDINPVRWMAGEVLLIDQTRLPHELLTVNYWNVENLAGAIETMVVRGAPAIGIAAAFGVALSAFKNQAGTETPILGDIERLRRTRPTAVNLFWALDRMEMILKECVKVSGKARFERLLSEAQAILQEDIAMCQAIGRHGAQWINRGDTVLTHCNAGALATGGWGTALGIIRSAWAEDKDFLVYATETRPRQQGARLTAWELQYSHIPVTLIPDTACGALMKAGKIQRVIVGSDRIAANGDVANKIGTYQLAVLAKHHDIPLIVAAPSSTIDARCPTGSQIPIEYRSELEVLQIGKERITAEGVPALNPAFDVTPAEYVTAIVTEKGVFQYPYKF